MGKKPTIDVVVCSKDAEQARIHRRNVLKTALVPLVYHRVENSENQFGGICRAYSAGFNQGEADIVVFVHEDVFFLQPGWGKQVLQLFDENPQMGLLGVAGSSRLQADNPLWVRAGRPWIHGRVMHWLNNGERIFSTEYSGTAENVVQRVAVVDGLFMAVRRSSMQGLGFDASTFGGYHFYDLDLCMQMHVAGLYQICVSSELSVCHMSGGGFDQSWKESAVQFLRKWGADLPVCLEHPEAKFPGEPFDNQDLRKEDVLIPC